MPREYRTGDDLRRVHWRATAQAGELMVRREEQPWRSRATIVLDLREVAHAGEGSASSLEFAVSAAASIAIHLVRRGFAVRVVDVDGTEVVPDVADGDVEGLVLDSLAVVGASASPAVAAHAATLRRQLGDGLLVAVLGRLELPDADLISRFRQGSATGLAIVLDTVTWGGAGAAGQAGTVAALLSAAGWRSSLATSADTVPAAWARLARGLQMASSLADPGTAGRSRDVSPGMAGRA